LDLRFLQFNNAVITLDYKKYINPTFLHIVKWPYSGFGIIRFVQKKNTLGWIGKSAGAVNQQSTDRHIARLGHFIQICSQPVLLFVIP
jgi:hypothetical protein